tara:strand:+ start:201 stop:719 length:519 start_codon:yes stop_codon:yes gene_type:complete
MLSSKIDNLIKNYPNFPKDGILFKDLTPILADPKIFSELIDEMSSYYFIEKADALIAIDARGFLFASAIGIKVSKPIILARKPGKLPGKLLKKEYNLEYGTNSLTLQKSSLDIGSKFVIIDDLLATGGTVNCVREILTDAGKKVLGLAVVVELDELGGRSKFSFPVKSIINY